MAQKIIKSQTNGNYFYQWYDDGNSNRPWFRSEKSGARKFEPGEAMKMVKKINAYFKKVGSSNSIKAISA